MALLIKSVLLASAVLVAAPAPVPSTPPADEWHTLPPPPAPPDFTQEEAHLMKRYIDVLEGAVAQLKTERDAARQRFAECQSRSRT